MFFTTIFTSKKYSRLSGSVIECGTWKGGMIAGIAYLLGTERKYYLFDSFEGLPPAKEIDGKLVIKWQADKTSPLYNDNCKATEQSARDEMEISGASKVSIIKGWFSETLSKTIIAM